MQRQVLHQLGYMFESKRPLQDIQFIYRWLLVLLLGIIYFLKEVMCIIRCPHYGQELLALLRNSMY